MKKQFVIALNSTTEEQEKMFLEYIKSNGFGWWHWIDNFWLVVDTQDKLSAEKLRDDLENIFPKVRKLVIEIFSESSTWAGYGPNGEQRNMFNWLHNTWKEG